jgi:23S rRNA (guanosine2251-2'-O)-methyltransferase
MSAGRGAGRRGRREAKGPAKGLWLYGRHAVGAALANPRRSCHRLLVTAEAGRDLSAPVDRPGLEVLTVTSAEIERQVGQTAVHQGLALSVAPLPAVALADACAPAGGNDLVLVLDQVNDPHNLGAMLRSAAAFGARAVVVPARHSALLAGATAKAASGALDVVPVVEEVNLARALDRLAELGYWLIGLDDQADATIDSLPRPANLALVLGAEGAGLRRLVAERCDLALRLPTSAAMPSLNVSVACGIALHAARRRDHQPAATAAPPAG